MKKTFVVFIILLTFLGCTSIPKRSNDWGGYSTDLETGLFFYHQYEITTLVYTRKGSKLITSPFFADLNKEIPVNTNSLNVYLFVNNPYSKSFKVFSNYMITDIETNKTLFKSKKLCYESQLLPKEFISVELPITSNINSQVIFSLAVYDENGMLYRTVSAKYKIGS